MAGFLLLISYPQNEGMIAKVLSKVEWLAIFFFAGLFVLVGALSVLCALSQMEGTSLVVMGDTLFDFIDKLTSNIILPIGGIAACVLVGWRMEDKVVFNELTSDGQFNGTMVRFFMFLAKWVCPIVIFYMFIKGLM